MAERERSTWPAAGAGNPAGGGAGKVRTGDTGLPHRSRTAAGAPAADRASAAGAGSAAATAGVAPSPDGTASGGPSPAGPLAGRRFLEVRFGGSGGQGVILMGVILALAATRDHRHVIQTQSYGPEARGGYSRSDVIISSRPVDYPQLLGIDLLVALSDEAAHRYAGMVKSTGVCIYDSEIVGDPPAFPCDTYAVPFTKLALEQTGKAQTANILTLGAVVGLTGVVSEDSLEKAVLSLVPKGSEEVNVKAMRFGLGVSAEEWRRPSLGGEAPRESRVGQKMS